jgi:hypothetical protein
MGEQNYAAKVVLVSASFDTSGTNSVVVGPPGFPMEVSQFRLSFGNASTGATPSVVTVTKRITPGSDSGALTLGTFSVAAGFSASDEVLIDATRITNVDLNSGEQLKFTSDGGNDQGTVYVSVIGNFVNPGPSPVKAFTETTRKAFANGTGTYNYLAFTNA